MFVTANQVEELTGYVVDATQVFRAQVVLEAYVGKLEAEVDDPYDQMLLARATAFQAAYMLNDPIKVYEQMSVSQLSQFGSTIAFKAGDNASPYIAKMAQMACDNLSWKKMRSVKIGSIFGSPKQEPGWRYN